MKITLPWLDMNLSDNGYSNKYQRYRIKKSKRKEAFWLTKQAKIDCSNIKKLRVDITFHPTPKVTPDKDNMVSAFKAYQDGIADAIKIDDGKWKVEHHIGTPIVGGAVTVEFSEADNE
jgi:hypothetical protein